MSTEQKDKQLVSLEAGDEFEDFPVEEWNSDSIEDNDTALWEEQWEDDDKLDDDFSERLKAELEKMPKP